jgi:hypothetical protein
VAITKHKKTNQTEIVNDLSQKISLCEKKFFSFKYTDVFATKSGYQKEISLLLQIIKSIDYNTSFNNQMQSLGA